MNRVIFVVILCFWSMAVSADLCESSRYIPNRHFVSVKKKIQKEMGTLANNIMFAREADKILSRLIAGKSPMIVSWMKKRSLGGEKDEVIVKKWRIYYLENFIIRRYSSLEQSRRVLIDSFFTKVNKSAFPEGVKGRFNNIFVAAKKFSLKRVDQFKISGQAKKQIKGKINSLNLFWFTKLRGSKFAKQPLEFFKWGIAYDPSTNSINVGTEANRYNTDETIFAVFAHEIGHVFDSCRWGAFFKGTNPFEKVQSCLRKSVGAQVRDDSHLESMVKSGKMDQQLALGLKMNPTCNKSYYPPMGVQKDQLDETFSDWFSAEVISISPYLTKEIRSDLCQEKVLMVGSSYLSDRERLNRVYLAHPVLRGRLKLERGASYCNLSQQKKM